MLLQILDVSSLLNESVLEVFPNSVINENVRVIISSVLADVGSDVSGLPALESDSIHIILFVLNLNCLLYLN